MTEPMRHQPDPKRDLVLERIVDVPRGLVWAAWTTPEHIKKWFTPAPWQTVDCRIDLRPGGEFHTVMRSPEGQEFPNTGCILEVVEHEKLAWTGALLPGYRPQPRDANERFPFLFSAVITMEPHGTGTKYTALAIHADEDGSAKHAEMGFHHGWGAAFDQLVAMVKTW
jgi:uncharacterized protein YndB with AHSA1/START domain